MSTDKQTITTAPYALPMPTAEGAQSSTAGGGLKEEVIANGSVVLPAAAVQVKRKLDPAEEAKNRDLEYKKRLAHAASLDRTRALTPDYETPFSYTNDALQRLLCYHVFTQVTVPDPKVDEDEWKKEFNSKALECSARLEKIKAQYEKHLLKSQSQPKEEKILLNKLSYFDEKFEVESLKTKFAPKPAAMASPAIRTAATPVSSMSRASSIPSPAVRSTSMGGLSVTPTSKIHSSSVPSTVPSVLHSTPVSASISHASSGHPSPYAPPPSHVPASAPHSTHSVSHPTSHPALHIASSVIPLPVAAASGTAHPPSMVAVVQTQADGVPQIVLAPSSGMR